MHPWQIALLVLIGIGFIVYARRDTRKRKRADQQFFAALVDRVLRTLEPQGFRLVRNEYHSRMFGFYSATFESPAFSLDLWLDCQEYDVRIARRTWDESGTTRREELETAWMASPPTHEDYARATEAIVAAAERISGAAATARVGQGATLRVHSDPFFLTDRGLSVICELVEGDVRLGATVTVAVPGGPGAASVEEAAVVEFALVAFALQERRELPSLVFGAKSGSETAEVLRDLLQPGVLLTVTSASASQPKP